MLMTSEVDVHDPTQEGQEFLRELSVMAMHAKRVNGMMPHDNSPGDGFPVARALDGTRQGMLEPLGLRLVERCRIEREKIDHDVLALQRFHVCGSRKSPAGTGMEPPMFDVHLGVTRDEPISVIVVSQGDENRNFEWSVRFVKRGFEKFVARIVHTDIVEEVAEGQGCMAQVFSHVPAHGAGDTALFRQVTARVAEHEQPNLVIMNDHRNSVAKGLDPVRLGHPIRGRNENWVEAREAQGEGVET